MSKNKEEDTLEALRQATREARECLKDFKAIIKEYRSLIDGWQKYVDKRIKADVTEGLEEFAKIQRMAEKEAVKAVFVKFDRLYDLLTTGGDHTKPSLSELIEAKVTLDSLKNL